MKIKYFVLFVIFLFSCKSHYDDPPPPQQDIPLPLAAPTNLVAESGDSVVYLSWDNYPDPEILYYEVARSKISGGPYQVIGQSVTNNYVDNNVENDIAYFYVVRVVK